jgi:hypothetical protein
MDIPGLGPDPGTTFAATGGENMSTTTFTWHAIGTSYQPTQGVPRNRDRVRLLAVTEGLIGEFAGQLPAGVVIACVTRCKTELADAGVRNGLPFATEAAARIRLASLATASACATSV